MISHELRGTFGLLHRHLKATLATSAALDEAPGTAEALRSGKLSADQAAVIAPAAVADPSSEQALVARAGVDSHAELVEASQKTRAAALGDDPKRRAAIRAKRALFGSTGADGSAFLGVRGPAEDVAEIFAAIEAAREDVFQSARQDGVRERAEAYGFDALVNVSRDYLAGRRGEATGPKGGRAKPKFILMVSIDAVVRGELGPGEECTIPGFGPYPLKDAIAQLGDATLSLVLSRGIDVRSVVTSSRHIATALRDAIAVRDRCCIVKGCPNRVVQIDHTASATGWADTGLTEFDWLGFLCHFHHDQKTHRGARLSGNAVEGWIWTTPPGEPALEPPGDPPGDPPDELF